NPNAWRIWNFDHDKRTDFPLQGAHEKLECKACHKDPVVGEKLELPDGCYSCHQKDDAHRGNYGQNCERCHVPTSFNELKPSLR
ncbi:MAG: cytochrome c family protein, partial [Proteobacteria bacterium]|nr:cytochrome c family protein [Pseudomonadota bacterium]